MESITQKRENWINGICKKEKYRTVNARKVNSKKFKDSYLYILLIDGTTHYKIGVSQNPKRRISDIRSSMPYTVKVVYLQEHKNTYELEEMIHDNFRDKEMNHEWFNLSQRELKTILNTLKNFLKEGYYLIRR